MSPAEAQRRQEKKENKKLCALGFAQKLKMTEPLIQLENITFAFPGNKAVLDGLNLSFHSGDRAGLIAPNGSGKTTLFHLIMGLIKPSAGTIRIFSRTVCEEKDFITVRRRIGLLFQDSDDQLFSPTVLEDVAFGPLNLGRSKKEAIAIAEATLASLDLGDFRDRITFKLSGGEKRLVALATIMAMQPEILLLDEPTTGLDIATQQQIVDILTGLDISYILISHNMDFLARLTSTIYTMMNGKIRVDETARLHPHYHLHQHGSYPHQHKHDHEQEL